MAGVEPKEDCPHVDAGGVSTTVLPLIDVSVGCAQCNNKSENWICLQCGVIGCSRFIGSHMVAHNEATTHPIAASFSDVSIWCYACESYIKHVTLNPFVTAILNSKEPPQPQQAQPPPPPPQEEPPAPKPARSGLGPLNPNFVKPKPKEKQEGEDEEEEEEEGEVADVVEIFKKLGIKLDQPQAPVTDYQKSQLPKVLSSLDIEGIAEYIKEGKAKNIIVMTGAGVSVAAGIPDFRTPGTGLYDNLQKYNLPYPTAVFEIDYFREKPEPFYLLAKELYPGNFLPTYAHYFIRLLHDKGVLLRNFTQNIDTLERVAKVPPSALVEAHGTFGSAHCVECQEEYTQEFVKEAVFGNRIPRCKCGSLVKPDIVFFGENLPSRFFQLMSEDFPKCDLLIVIGTSLKVQPFASLVKKVGPNVPRLLINNEVVGVADVMDLIMPSASTGFQFNSSLNFRDVKYLGDCQDNVKKLAELCGWLGELEALMEVGKKELHATTTASATAAATTSTTTAATDTSTSTATTEATPAAASAAATPIATAEVAADKK